MPKVLLVEDEGLVALYLKNILWENGFEKIILARNGEEAILKARDTDPDLVLMDIRLGRGINGIEAVKKINQKKNTPVIYITASTDEHTHREASATNPLAIISKPVEPEEIRDMIINYFNGFSI